MNIGLENLNPGPREREIYRVNTKTHTLTYKDYHKELGPKAGSQNNLKERERGREKENRPSWNVPEYRTRALGSGGRTPE